MSCNMVPSLIARDNISIVNNVSGEILFSNREFMFEVCYNITCIIFFRLNIFSALPSIFGKKAREFNERVSNAYINYRFK